MPDHPPISRKRVLFLDDDADILDAAELVLARQGMLLVKERDPQAAAERLARERFDLILLDLNFHRGETSGEAGLAFLTALLDRQPMAVVVIVTGHSGVNIAVAAMRLGAADVVMKPWNNDRFIATIAAALDHPRRHPAFRAGPDDLNLNRSEVTLIKQALQRYQFNISQAAQALGLTRAALYRRMEKHGL